MSDETANPAPPLDQIPQGTRQQIDETRRLIRQTPTTPLFPTGTVTVCQVCGEDAMVTTNSLEMAIPTPVGLRVVVRLPGAECRHCGTRELDAAGLAILEQQRSNEIVADYETTVTTVGPMLATYLKGDLRRILHLRGGERLRWKVLDGSRALIEVER